MSSKAFAYCLIPFIVVATLNAGGYRYGASDQAFYIPAALLNLDPSLFPRDAALIEGQARLTTSDDVIALAVKLTGVPLPSVFAAMYLLSLVLIGLGVYLIARRFYQTTWATVALLAAMTLRHAIARSGTNTLEGYFHPRQIAFGMGLLAVAAFLRGRIILAAVCLVAGGSVHPTATLWFAVWLGTAAVVTFPTARRIALIAAVPTVALALWTLTAGPLAGGLRVMDAEWLQALATKDYLFILQWPLYAWIFNLGYLVIIPVIYAKRVRAEVVGPYERGLVLGSLSLVAVFVGAMVTQGLHLVVAFQMQPARLFLIFDFLATAYVVWALAEMPRPPGVKDPANWRPLATAAFVIAFAIVRGAYVLYVADRPAVQWSIADDDWGRAMQWAKTTTDKGGNWLADPLHAFKYGTTVRVAGERDLFVDAGKDTAMGLYDRSVAMRTAERLREVDQFPRLTTEELRAVGARHGIDYLVTEGVHALPVAFESGTLRVYRLR